MSNFLKNFTVIFITAMLLCSNVGIVFSQNVDNSAEGVVRELYDQVTFPKGTSPDWDKVSDLFVKDAVVVLRTSRTAMSVFSREGFIDDFKAFIVRDKVEERGFEEKIIKMHKTEMGDMANIWVHFTADFPDDKRPPQHGVDCMTLMKQDGKWKIVSITNEFVRPAAPLPDILKDGGK